MENDLQKAKKFKKVFLYSLLALLGAGILATLTSTFSSSLDFMVFVASALLIVIPLLLVAVVITFLLWIAALIANQAALKGRSWQSFFILSIFFPFIMWIVVSVMTTDQSQPISGTKKCPKCAEYVKKEATLCKHCGSAI
jgi:uncharacterized membrane protein